MITLRDSDAVGLSKSMLFYLSCIAVFSDSELLELHILYSTEHK